MIADERADIPSTAALEYEYGLFGASDSHALTFDAGVVCCSCEQCTKWAAYVACGNEHGQPYYLIPTLELVRALCDWLCVVAVSAQRPLRVLEVGAGDGALAHHLQIALEARHAPITIVATDSMSRGLHPVPGAHISCRDATEAVTEHEPQIVLCAFMPLGMDWTRSFRACESVEAYLLLGETDDGCCGRPWATWGYLCDGDDDAAQLSVSSTSGSESDELDNDQAQKQVVEAHGHTSSDKCVGLAKRQRTEVAHDGWRKVYAFEPGRTPWGVDGWERVDSEPLLEQMTRVLLCCTDTCWSSQRHARATLFRRASR